MKASDFCIAGRYARQDRERRERRRVIEAAEERYDGALAAYEAEDLGTPGNPAWEAFEQARDALYELNPRKTRFP